MKCPNCYVSLEKVKDSEMQITSYFCNKCRGRAVYYENLFQFGNSERAEELLRIDRGGHWAEKRTCPSCEHKMSEIFLNENKHFLVLDICKDCRLFWFDPHEYDSIPKRNFNSRRKRLEQLGVEKAKEKLASSDEGDDDAKYSHAKLISAYAKHSQIQDAPDNEWRNLITFLGLPMEWEEDRRKKLPWVSWLLVVIVFITSMCSFPSPSMFSENFALAPAKLSLEKSYTLLTHIFIHSNIVHLLSNLYFLKVFGDNLEDIFGEITYIFFIAITAITSGLFYVVLNQGSEIPAVGISGSVAAIMAFYALELSERKLALGYFNVFYGFQYLKIPVLFAYLIWLFFQSISYAYGDPDILRIAYEAHIGGMFMGFILWLFFSLNPNRR